jgi:hypothetical protein
MATSYKTPGVYIEEISKFPPSVAQVETAIPAFVGYTESAIVDGVDYHTENIIKPVKIGSLPEYEFFFGGAPKPTSIEVVLNPDDSVKSAKINGVNLLYDSIRMFYANGGGDCYIVSVGGYNTSASGVSKDELIVGLATLEKVDLPTLLVIPETVHLPVDKAGVVHSAMLSQCNILQDRFAILDLVDGDTEITPTKDPVADFRDNVGMNYLKYGAAYYPFLKTTLSFKIDYDAIVGGSFTKDGSPVSNVKTLFNTTIVSSIEAIDADIAAKTSLVAPTIGVVGGRPQLITVANDLYNYFKAFFDLSFTDNSTSDKNSAASIHAKYIAGGSNFDGLLTMLYDYNHFSTAGANIPSGWTDLLITEDFAADFSPLTFAVPATSKNDIYVSSATAVNAAPYFKALLGKLTAFINDFYSELKASRANRTETLKEVDKVYKGIVDSNCETSRCFCLRAGQWPGDMHRLTANAGCGKRLPM